MTKAISNFRQIYICFFLYLITGLLTGVLTGSHMPICQLYVYIGYILLWIISDAVFSESLAEKISIIIAGITMVTWLFLRFYEKIYYANLIFITILIFLLIYIFVKNKKYKMSLKLWIPGIITTMIILCTHIVFVHTGLSDFKLFNLDYSVVVCLIFMICMDEVIGCKRLYLNKLIENYLSFSMLDIGLYDKKGKFIYGSEGKCKNVICLNEEDDDNSEEKNEENAEDNSESFTVESKQFALIYNIDNSILYGLQKELEDVRAVVSNEDYLNKAMDSLEAKNAILEDLTALNNQIENANGKQLREIGNILDNINNDSLENLQKDDLKELCIRALFAKCKAKMVIEAKESGVLSVNALADCIHEIFGHLNNWGYFTTFINYGKNDYDISVLLKLLDNVEAPLERSICSLREVRIILDENSHALNMDFNIISPNGNQKTYKFRGHSRKAGD